MFRPVKNFLSTLNRVKECRAVHTSCHNLTEVTEYECKC